MNKYNFFSITIFLLLTSCSWFANTNTEELKRINSGLIQHYEGLEHKFLKSTLLLPNRFSTNYNLYQNFKNENEKIDLIIDSLIVTKNYNIDKKIFVHFNKLKTLIDSIYISRNAWVGEKSPQKTNLDKFLYPLENALYYCTNETDMHFIKLYLNLIDREVITFLYEKAMEGTIPINFIKPITVEKENKKICYVAGVDTCNYPIIYIGKFKSYIVNNYLDYKAIEIIDTIHFNKEKAEIKIEQWKKYDAILEYKFPNGAIGRYKLE
jgi:hypothetical protein